MNRFYSAVSSVLEVDEVGPETKFRETEGWCSLHGFGLLVMMENDWKAPLTVERFLGMKTVRDLYREAFIALAAEVFAVDRAALSGSTARGSIEGWDSVNHLRLVMEAEKRFGCSYPLEKIPSLGCIDDFLV